MVWSADGRRLFYGSNQDGPFKVFTAPADGSAEGELLVDSDVAAVPTSISPDGATLLFYKVSIHDLRDIWSVRLGEEPQPILATRANERAPVFSPDARFFAYVSDKTGEDEVYVRRFPDDGSVWKISSGGGTEPLWTPDGAEVVYRIEDRFVVVDIGISDDGVQASPPRELFRGDFRRDQFGNAGYQIAPDGERLLVMREVGSAQAEIHVVLNWFEELRRLAPEG